MMPFWLAPDAQSVLDRPARSGRDGGRRARAEAPMRVERSSAGPLLVEAYGADEMAAVRDDWDRLLLRSLEPNVFMEPAFCLSAALHLSSVRRPVFVCVWSLDQDGPRTLLAICPLIRPRLPFRRVASSWFHDLAALAAPLLDRDHAAPALQAILAWIGWRHPGCGAWLVPSLATSGPTARALEAVADQTSRRMRLLDRRHRAVLGPPGDHCPAGLEAVSRKKAKDLQRLRRRLEGCGTLRYRSAQGGDELRDALEQFLMLEARGWKGRRGTALLMRPEQAAFARAMTRLMARAGQCRVDSLTLDGAPVAMGIILSSRNREYFWKMAYDEAHAGLSPGVQFVLDLTSRQRQAPGVELTDSCAQPDHPMIDHLWSGRLDLADALIAVSPGAGIGFPSLYGLERLRRGARSGVKAAVLRLRAAVGR